MNEHKKNCDCPMCIAAYQVHRAVKAYNQGGEDEDSPFVILFAVFIEMVNTGCDPDMFLQAAQHMVEEHKFYDVPPEKSELH